MNRLLSLVAFFLTLGTLSAAEKLNVVLILADDLGWADLSCYGSKYHKTPNLDRLASEGMRFTNGYASCPVCSPTRASMMTGQYPPRTGITDWLPGRGDRPDQKLNRPKLVNDLPATDPSIALAFKNAGYVTGHIGKWHLGGKEARPQDRGFDVNIAGDHTGTPLSYFAPYKAKDGRVMPGLENAPEGEYLTDRYGLEAERFIETNKDKPFFLYLPHNAVHTPMRAKADLVAKYKPRPLGQQGNPFYAAMLESLDDAVGRVLKKLDDLKLTERTIVVFTSDNGGLATLEGKNTPATNNSPLREGKGYLYEGGIRVPLVVKWPGVVKPGTTSDALACTIDFYPTLLSACGISNDVKVDGLDLVPLLKGGKVDRDKLYWHYPHYANQGGKPGGAMRVGNMKYIEFYEDNRRELFDLAKDMGENRNLAEEKPALVKEYAKQLDAWRKSVGAKMPTPNPNYRPNPQAKNGNIVLPARTAQVHGTMLRFEPLPHKNTLGYWVNERDWASFEFTVVARAGKFTVEILQGCGKGQGGSEVEVAVGDQVLSFIVEDTGHFQNFKPRTIGEISIDKPGRHTLTIKPKKKKAAAIMDVREVKLKAVGEEKK